MQTLQNGSIQANYKVISTLQLCSFYISIMKIHNRITISRSFMLFCTCFICGTVFAVVNNTTVVLKHVTLQF